VRFVKPNFLHRPGLSVREDYGLADKLCLGLLELAGIAVARTFPVGIWCSGIRGFKQPVFAFERRVSGVRSAATRCQTGRGRNNHRAPVLVVQGHVAKYALVRGPARHPPRIWSLRPDGGAVLKKCCRNGSAKSRLLIRVTPSRAACTVPARTPTDAPHYKAGARARRTRHSIFRSTIASAARMQRGRPAPIPAPKAATSARASIGCSKPSRRDVDMVAAWSVDRLGRCLIDLLDFLRELHAKGFDLFLHQQGLDTSTPSGRAMFQMLGVFAEFERSMIRERVMAGLSRAKADGIQLGRRRLEDSDADKVAAIVAARAKGTGIRRIARELGVGVGTVLRVTGEARLCVGSSGAWYGASRAGSGSRPWLVTSETSSLGTDGGQPASAP
jgi:hypothetical protein